MKRATPARSRGGVLALAEFEAAFGPAPSWAGRCFEAASACVRLKLVDGVAVYGHYLGEVAEGSHFASHRGLPFQRHGWVRRPGGRIFDPTRWAFTGEEPQLFEAAPGHPDYDEGGNAHRGRQHEIPPRFDLEERHYNIDDSRLCSEAWSHVEELLGADYSDGHEPGVLCESQLLWLANQPYDVLEPHARAVYRMLRTVGHGAMVPIDNEKRAEREEAEVKKSTGKKRARTAKSEAAPKARSARSRSRSKAAPGPGRPRVAEQRKQSHVPLHDHEREKLHAAAASADMSYGTWGRRVLLAVAALPAGVMRALAYGTGVVLGTSGIVGYKGALPEEGPSPTEIVKGQDAGGES